MGGETEQVKHTGEKGVEKGQKKARIRNYNRRQRSMDARTEKA